LRPILAIVTIALLTVALVATALYVGSQRRLPEPLFRNGAVVYAANDDLFIADQLNGTPRPLVTGPETDGNPVFSPLGDRVAFIREGPDGNRLMSVNADGSGLTALTNPASFIADVEWSPDGTAVLAVTVDNTNVDRVEVMAADGSGSRVIDIGGNSSRASWRPDGRHIAVSGSRDNTYIANADGSTRRPLPGINGSNDLAWSPDGRHLALLSGDDDDMGLVVNVSDIDADGAPKALRQLTIVNGASTMVWSPDGKYLAVVSYDGSHGMRVSMAEIEDAGAMTNLPPLMLDPWFTDSGPEWSPDGSQLAFELRTDSALRAGIVNPDGSGLRLIGPEVLDPGQPSGVQGRRIYDRQIDVTWAPDGRSVVLFEHPWRDPTTPLGPDARVWSVDLATGEQTEVDMPVGDWQRLAP
jgi:Tol biopolymer transport system component